MLQLISSYWPPRIIIHNWNWLAVQICNSLGNSISTSWSNSVHHFDIIINLNEKADRDREGNVRLHNRQFCLRWMERKKQTTRCMILKQNKYEEGTFFMQWKIPSLWAFLIGVTAHTLYFNFSFWYRTTSWGDDFHVFSRFYPSIHTSLVFPFYVAKPCSSEKTSFQWQVQHTCRNVDALQCLSALDVFFKYNLLAVSRGSNIFAKLNNNHILFVSLKDEKLKILMNSQSGFGGFPI